MKKIRLHNDIHVSWGITTNGKQESLEAKTAQFEAAFQSLSQTILDSNLLKWFVDFGTGSVNALEWVIDKIGTLGTIGVIGGGILGAKNAG